MTTTPVTAIGPDMGIVLPAEVLKKLNASPGDQLCLIDTPTGVELQRVDPELAEQLAAAEIVMREDFEALRKLAQ